MWNTFYKFVTQTSNILPCCDSLRYKYKSYSLYFFVNGDMVQTVQVRLLINALWICQVILQEKRRSEQKTNFYLIFMCIYICSRRLNYSSRKLRAAHEWLWLTGLVTELLIFDPSYRKFFFIFFDRKEMKIRPSALKVQEICIRYLDI